MKITAKSRYALRMLVDMAVHGDGGPRTIREISESQGLSEKFVGRIAIALKRAGLLVTARGVKGGLALALFPEKITLLDIVTATDGPLALVHCLARPGACAMHGRCAAEKAWSGVNDALASYLKAVTLASVAAEARTMASSGEQDYCI